MATNPARRSLKLVLTLQPREPVGYRVLVALGADGCDPLMRCVEAENLPTILAAIPSLLSEAEARWAVQPRYPMASASKARTRPAASTSAAPPPTTEPGDGVVSPEAPADGGASAIELPAPAPPPPSPAPAAQMSLFG